MCRFQFLEAAGRIALARWHKTGEVPDAAAALHKLAERMTYLIVDKEEDPEFRERCWREEVEDGAKAKMDGLRRAFKAHSGKEDQLSKDKYMSFPEWLAFVEAVDLVDADGGFTDRDVNVAFLRAMRTPTDELANDVWRRLDFPRFLEALMRVGDKTVDEDVDEEPSESCVDLFGAVADAFPSAAEKRKRAALDVEREKQKQQDADREAAEAAKKQAEAKDAAKPPRKASLGGTVVGLLAAKKAAKSLGAKVAAKRRSKGDNAANDDDRDQPKESAAAALMAAMAKRPTKAKGAGPTASSIPMSAG